MNIYVCLTQRLSDVKNFRRIGFVLVAMLATTITNGVSLEAAPPSVESVSPPMVKLGSSAEIEIIGAGLSRVSEVVFYSAGIRATKIDSVDDYKLRVTLEVQDTCSVANHAFRLRGADGFSELRTISTNRFPVMREGERESVDAVKTVPSENITVLGVLQSGDYDRYEVRLMQGQRWTAEVAAMRLGGELLDTVLTVFDSHGKALLSSDDDSLLRQDPSFTLVVPEDGSYVFEIRESNYGGSSNSHYALHLGSFPPTAVAFPAGGQLGTQLQIQFLTGASGSSNSLMHMVSLPTEPTKFQLFSHDEQQRSPSPVPFRLSSFPNVFEANESLTSNDQLHMVPIALNGILEASGEVDRFDLQIEAGQSIKIEAFADRIGSPIDTYLELYDASGRLLAQNDDWDSHDSAIEFASPATGKYVITIRDKLHRGTPRGVYRIEVSPNSPSLTTFLPRPERTSQRQQAICVPQGNRVLAKVAVRRDNIEGAVELRFADLPDGVRATPVYVPANAFWAIAILEADASAPVAGKLSQLIATSQTTDHQVKGGFNQVVDLIAESADRLYHSALVDRLAVAVTPPVPFAIELEQSQTDLAIDGTIELKIRLTRSSNFTGAVRVEFPFLPDGCAGEPFILIGSDQDHAVYQVSATTGAAQGDYRLAANATVSLSEGRQRTEERGGNAARGTSKIQAELNDLKDREVASNLIDLHIGSNPIEGAFSGLASERGASATVHCQLKFNGPVPNEMVAQLEGLPKGVAAQPLTVKAEQDRVSFDLSVSPQAPVGKFAGVVCRLTGHLHGSKVSYLVPTSSPLIIAEQGKLQRAEDGSVLSPLEALRKENGK